MVKIWKCLLLLSLLGSTWAAAVSPVGPASGDFMHEALHWAAQAHHHHEDGSAHVDTSADSTQHVAVDLLSCAVGLPCSGSPCALTDQRQTYSQHQGVSWSPHHPEGLFRPPCPTA